MLTPTPHQERIISDYLNANTTKHLNGSEVGTGKTLVATEFVRRAGEKVNLVTAPLHTRSGWERHFDLQGMNELRFATTKNKSGQQAISDLMFGVPGNYFMGRELARLQDWSSSHIDTWVADEVHSMANGKSRAFKSHNQEAMPTTHRLFQSATWFGAKFENARTIAQLLWPELDGYGEIADRVAMRWIDHWCSKGFAEFWTKDEKLVARAKRSGSGEVRDSATGSDGEEVRWLLRMFSVTGERNPGSFAAAMPSYARMESDLPELEPIEIRYEMSSVQRKMYKEMEAESLAWLRDQSPLVVELDATRRIRLREIALAEPVLDGAGQIQFPDDAKSALADIVREMSDDLGSEQILMGTHSAKFSKFLGKRLGIFSWAGDSTEEAQEKAKAEFMAGNLRSIVGSQAKLGEGIDGLQVARVMFELSLNDNPILNQQFRGRLRRRGQERKIVDYRFVAVGTIDDAQHESLLTKELNMRQSAMKEVAA